MLARGTRRSALGLAALAIVLVVLTAAFALTGSLGAASAAGRTTAEIANGDWARINFYTDRQEGVYDCGGSLKVTSHGIGKSLEIHLWYYIEAYEPGNEYIPCVTVEYGHGVIPNADYKVNGQTSTLNTDSSKMVDLEERMGAGGPISLTWIKTDVVDYGGTGTYYERLYGWLTRVSGQWTQDSARAEGWVIGRYAYSPQPHTASVGTYSQATIITQRVDR